MKPFKEWAEEYGIEVNYRVPLIEPVSDIPISEDEFQAKVMIHSMRLVDQDRFNAKVLRR